MIEGFYPSPSFSTLFSGEQLLAMFASGTPAFHAMHSTFHGSGGSVYTTKCWPQVGVGLLSEARTQSVASRVRRDLNCGENDL